eukprot:scaffold6504_cov127-Skeletonema_dohrnii-CCMP3373.AAC.7
MESLAEDTTPPPSSYAQGRNMNHLHSSGSSMKANSSDYGDIMEEGGEEVGNPETAADTTERDHDDYGMTAEEKKEADIPIVSVPIDSSTNNDPDSHEQVANNETSKPPLPAVVVGGSSIITFKFSYEPRDYEQEYYDQLFYRVASTSNTPAAANKSKEEIIVPPKEAAKLFYTSGVPPERLRMIWNMATLPSTPLPPGTKPPPAMTYGQFKVAVRLIQLFQNRVAAVDEQLTVSEENSGEGGGGGSDGGLVRLAPAYFNGISGEFVPLPSNNAVEAIKTMYGVPASETNGAASTPNGVTRQARRRSSSLSSNEEKRPSNGRMNGNMPAYEEANNAAQPMSLVEMEREIRRLSVMVGSLQREVKELKRGNSHVPRNTIVEDEDPTVGVEIYWGERKEKEQSPEKRAVTPNEVPLKAKVQVAKTPKNMRSSMPTPPQSATMDNRKNTVSRNRLSQSQNIPAMHPSIPRRTKNHLGIPASGAATGVAQVSMQPIQIPEEGESLTSQMHAVRKQEEFDTLLSHAKDRVEGDSASKTGSRQSNRSGSFRPALLSNTSRRNRLVRDNRPADLSASARHIIRDKTGKVELYKVEPEPPSTKAVDLTPLTPPPLRPTFDEETPIPVTQNHRRSLIRRR